MDFFEGLKFKNELKSISASRIYAYEHCPRRYAATYIYKVKAPEVKVVYLEAGNCVHETLEIYYNRAMKVGFNPPMDELLRIYNKVKKRYSLTEDPSFDSIAVKCLVNHMDIRTTDPSMIAGNEVRLRMYHSNKVSSICIIDKLEVEVNESYEALSSYEKAMLDEYIQFKNIFNHYNNFIVFNSTTSYSKLLELSEGPYLTRFKELLSSYSIHKCNELVGSLNDKCKEIEDILSNKGLTLLIIDYKTGSKKTEVDSLQMCLYTLTCKYRYPLFSNYKVVTEYLKLRQVASAVVPHEKLRESKVKVSSFIDLIKNADRHHFKPTVNPFCDTCQVKGTCSLYS